ncbi:MAG: AAA family ATPase [Eubacteriales bacterium]
MKISYITIEREYGSGGSVIACRLAEEIGIPCYGREILEAVAAERGIAVSEVERYEETVTNSFLYSAYIMAKAASGNTDMLSQEGHLFVAEQAAIKRFAAEGSSVFIGHCASEALRDRNDAVHVFIRCSDEEEKQRRIVSDYGIPEADADRIRKKYDKKRSNYYYSNTLRRWEDIRNYDMVLDSATLGIDGCVAVLKSLFC